MTHFAENLRNSMRMNGFTQKRLAEEVNTTQQTVSRWLNGINEPDFETLLKICALLHESPNDLLGYHD